MDLFQLRAHGTNVRREVLAGVTTFAAMAYILAVNPAVLSATGMDKGAVITATAVASALMTALMALFTNYPIALAPGMGINAFFAFSVCGVLGIPWQAALGFVFYSGAVFFLLSVTGIRKRLVDALPRDLKIAITCGIGLFIAFIGLKNGGVIAANAATFVTLGDLHQPVPWLALGGLVFTAALVQRKAPGAILIGMAAVTVVGCFVSVPGPDGVAVALTQPPQALVAPPASLAPTFLQLDLAYFWQHPRECIPIVLALLFVDLFDNMGTLIGVCHRAGLLDAQGNLPRIGRALAADATAAMAGSVLGTSTVTSYIESATGVEAGGRTGLTALAVAACFLLALFVHPLIAVVPGVATAPALILVGVFMMQAIAEVDLRDFRRALPVVLTLLTMPLAFSIAEGIAIGISVHVLFHACIGHARSLSWLEWALAALCLLHLYYR